jgi:hypothetical protein
MARPSRLSSITIKKAHQPPHDPRPTPPAVIGPHQRDTAAGRKGQTLRLQPDAWKQLKLLAVERETTAHDLLIEAVNSLFEKYGKPKIA